MKISLPDGIKINAEIISNHLINFTGENLKNAGFSKLVLGVSGGIDSALVAYLASQAIGAKNITGVILPYKTSNPDNIKDAELVIDTLGFKKEAR